ncbi:MAG: hypothetical protein HUK20_00050, partial [Fibrobacter sp.]|nr:hypothetical protein [Fibrobacter sp.]
MKHFYTLFIVALACMSAYAQEIKVSGSVKDAQTGEDLIGVSIVEDGT